MPDLVVHDPELAFRVWTVLRAVQYRWTITDVLAQPEALLDDVLALELGQQRSEAVEKNG